MKKRLSSTSRHNPVAKHLRFNKPQVVNSRKRYVRHAKHKLRAMDSQISARPLYWVHESLVYRVEFHHRGANMTEVLVVTRENLAQIFPEIRVVELGQSYRYGGIVLVSQTPIVEGDARYKVTRFVKDGKPVFMDSRSRRGNHEVFLVEDGDELFYARYRSFKGKGRLVPPDEEAVCTTSGVEHGSPEIEGFFKKLKNPLL